MHTVLRHCIHSLLFASVFFYGLLLTTSFAQAQPADRPNILLLVAEDLSPRIGAYGDGVAHTPNIDKLAATGMIFTQAFTTAGVCAPSRAALLTGQHQISFGAQHMRTTTGPLGRYLAQPNLSVRAFPELLREAGYFTFTDKKLDYQFSGIRAGTGPFTIWNEDGAQDTAWRQRKPDEPFFGLINFMETHESGVMRSQGPTHSESHQQTQKMRKVAKLIAPTMTSPDDVVLPAYYPDLPEVRADMARHYDNIRNMDRRVGQIMLALAQDNLLDKTIIIWTTDHGDGLPRAKRELFDSGIHVPFIITIPQAYTNRWPAYVSANSSDKLISFVDIAPTLLQFANLKLSNYLHGSSIFGQANQYVFASRDRIDEVVDRQRAIRSRRYKYIRSWHPEVAGGHKLAYRDNLDMVQAMRLAYESNTLNPTQARWFEGTAEHQLYDLVHDPLELHNLANEDELQPIRQQLSLELDRFLTTVGDTSNQSESELRSKFLNGTDIPKTRPPQIEQDANLISLLHPLGSSIGYRILGTQSWNLYTQPIAVDTLRKMGRSEGNLVLEAKAIRYGWKESKVVKYHLTP